MKDEARWTACSGKPVVGQAHTSPTVDALRRGAIDLACGRQDCVPDSRAKRILVETDAPRGARNDSSLRPVPHGALR